MRLVFFLVLSGICLQADCIADTLENVRLQSQSDLEMCPGGVLVFTCLARGTSVLIDGPPFISVMNPIIYSSSDNKGRGALGPQASTVLLDKNGTAENTTFLVQLTVTTLLDTIPSDYTLRCQVFGGSAFINFTVIDPQSMVVEATHVVTVSNVALNRDRGMATMNISWPRMDNVVYHDIFVLEKIIPSTSTNKTFELIEVPYGEYNVLVVAVGMCGTSSQLPMKKFAAMHQFDTALTVTTITSFILLLLTVVFVVLFIIFLVLYIRIRNETAQSNKEENKKEENNEENELKKLHHK